MASIVGALAPRLRTPTGIKIRRNSGFDESAAATWCRQKLLSDQARKTLRSWEFEDWLRHKRRISKVDLSQGAAYVVKKLIAEMDWNTGFCRVAYAGLAYVCRLARSTVQRIIQQLERLGVVERLRTVDMSRDPNGPTWVQGYNAYRLCIPKEFWTWLGERFPAGLGLVPADALQAAQEGRRANARHHAEHLANEAQAAQDARHKRARDVVSGSRPVFGPGSSFYQKLLADSLKASTPPDTDTR